MVGMKFSMKVSTPKSTAAGTLSAIRIPPTAIPVTAEVTIFTEMYCCTPSRTVLCMDSSSTAPSPAAVAGLAPDRPGRPCSSRRNIMKIRTVTPWDSSVPSTLASWGKSPLRVSSIRSA